LSQLNHDAASIDSSNVASETKIAAGRAFLAWRAGITRMISPPKMGSRRRAVRIVYGLSTDLSGLPQCARRTETAGRHHAAKRDITESTRSIRRSRTKIRGKSSNVTQAKNFGDVALLAHFCLLLLIGNFLFAR